ncbi:MAG: ArsR/SmtB family transcription factor, partial [Candidatus Dormibacteria bacterium]
ANPPAGDLAAHFVGLANPTRLQIVRRLAQVKEERVSDVALLLGISQPRMSWHLRLLRRAGIVKTKREGREVLCRLDRESIAANVARLERMLDGRSDGDGALGSGVGDNGHQAQPRGSGERSMPEVVG